MKKPVVALQLYTLRSETEKDFLGTIRKVAEIGYKAVEFAGYFGVSAKDLRRHLEDCGLAAPSAHVGLDFGSLEKMEDGLKAQIEYAQELGLSCLVTPGAPFSERPTQEEIDHVARFLARAGELVTAAGMRYGYHNHDFEFKRVNGKTIIDQLLEKVPADLMFAQFDLGWVQASGNSPVEYVKKYAGRVPLLHIKDILDAESDTEVGRGIVNYESVLAIGEEAGVEYYIVEQEQFERPPLESARISLQFFRDRGLG